MAGRRHLTESEAVGALRRGAGVEQLLGLVRTQDGRASVRWLTASSRAGAFVLSLHEVEDVGGDDFLDVTEFPPLDPQEYVGEGRKVAHHDDPSALLGAAVEHGASPDLWVNFGVVATEYAEARQAP